MPKTKPPKREPAATETPSTGPYSTALLHRPFPPENGCPRFLSVRTPKRPDPDPNIQTHTQASRHAKRPAAVGSRPSVELQSGEQENYGNSHHPSGSAALLSRKSSSGQPGVPFQLPLRPARIRSSFHELSISYAPLPRNVENLSRGTPKIQSNDPSFHTTYTPNYPKIVGTISLITWYSDNRG